MWKKGIFHPILNGATSITNRTVGDQVFLASAAPLGRRRLDSRHHQLALIPSWSAHKILASPTPRLYNDAKHNSLH
jgi:hypothetical protein